MTEQSTRSNIDRVSALFASFAKGDVDGVRRAFDEPTAWLPLAGVLAGDYRGPDAILSLFARMRRETDGTFRSVPQAIDQAGERVFVEARITGERNGERLDMPIVMVFSFAGQTLREVRLHANDYPAFSRFWAD